jgi:hypothetical protein
MWTSGLAPSSGCKYSGRMRNTRGNGSTNNPIRMRAIDTTDITRPDDQRLAGAIVIASDSERALWAEQDVAAARKWLVSEHGEVLAISHLMRLFGAPAAHRFVKAFTGLRRELRDDLGAVLSVPAPSGVCHDCGTAGDVTRHLFGLARAGARQESWSEAGVAAALSAIAFPVVGLAFIAGPSESVAGPILRLEIQFCIPCEKKRKPFFGKVYLREDDYALHPRWRTALRHGFRQFLPGSDLVEKM